MSAPLFPAKNDPLIEHELFRLGYRNVVITGFAQAVLAMLVTLAARQSAPPEATGVWTSYMLLVSAAYFFESWNFRERAAQVEYQPRVVQQWRLHRRMLQLFSSLGWGALSFLLVPGAEVHNIIIMTTLAGMLGFSAANNTTSDFRGFFVCALGLILVLLSQLPPVFGERWPMIATLYIFYLAMLMGVMRNADATMRSSIQLRLANEALAQESARQARRAEQANRSKSEFLAAASHDLRQPVHALLLLIEAYRQQDAKVASHPLVQQISAAGHSISGLFNALMELSRLQSGNEKPVLEDFALRPVLQQALERARPAADHKGLTLRLHVSAALERCAVRTDRLLLERSLGNLLSNAVRYTQRGGVMLALRRAPRGDGVVMEVWDTGLGIAESDLGRIFDPYVQIGNTERDRSKGLGLGLAIVRHASQLLGLNLSVRSVPGRGSVFRLQVPQALCSVAPDLAPAAASAVPPLPRLSLRGRRVLLVDDDPMVLQAMQALLLGWELDLRCASRGDESVLQECAPDWEPECIICDFRLPGRLHGVELLDLLLERFPQAVGILQTGELAQAVQSLAEESGYLVLSKPVDPAVLASTLSALLDRSAGAVKA